MGAIQQCVFLLENKCLSELCNSLIILFALTTVDLKSKRPFRIQFTRAKVNRILMLVISLPVKDAVNSQNMTFEVEVQTKFIVLSLNN